MLLLFSASCSKEHKEVVDVEFDPDKTYKIDKDTFASKGKNTPFDGYEVSGEVVCTIVDGRVVYGPVR